MDRSDRAGTPKGHRTAGRDTDVAGEPREDAAAGPGPGPDRQEEGAAPSAPGPSALPPTPPRLTRPVYFADRLPARQRRRGDLTELVLCVIGIALAWLFGVYAHSTTQAVTEDVLRVNVVREVLLLPVTLVEGTVVLIAPIAVIVSLARRRRIPAIVESVLTALAAAASGWALLLVLNHLPEAATEPLRVATGEGSQIALNLVIVSLVALFTAAGEANNMKSVRYSWWGLWLVAFLGVARGSMTLPGALISVLLGRCFGSAARWLMGFEDRRATGLDLVGALLSIGIVPSRIIRADLDTTDSPLTTWAIDEEGAGGGRVGGRVGKLAGAAGGAGIAGAAGTTRDEDGAGDRSGAPGGARSVGDEGNEGGADLATLPDGDFDDNPDLATGVEEVLDGLVPTTRPLRQRTVEDIDLVEYTVTRRPVHDDSRHYVAWDQNGTPLDVHVIDPGRELAGTAMEVWNNLRLRGISRWISPSLKANAERSTLTVLSAIRAGVHVPEPLGLAQAGDSMLVVHRAAPPTSSLRDAPPEVVTDDVLDQAWRQLQRAHSRGISHRALTFDSVVIDATGQVWLMDWEQGEVATTELNRRIDVAQLLVHLAVCVGAERALASARRTVGETQLHAAAPVLQNAVLPAAVNSAVRRSDLVSELRSAIVGDQPAQAAQLLNIQRFSPRTVVMVVVIAVVLFVVLGSLNFSDIIDAVSSANPMWILVAFGLSAVTWVGGAIPLVALTSERIRLRDAALAQVAASVVSIVAPAGIGPAALNLRFLNKQKVPTPMAVTTVTLQQISQFLTTVLLLLTIVVFTGSSMSVSLPYSTILAIAVGVAVVITVTLSVPKLRHLIWEKVQPTWKQVYPRLLWTVGQPRRILAVLGGNLLMNVGYIGSFAASLAAFGGHLDLMTLAITYLVSNSLGSVIPSPGGIGPVEGALFGGLRVAGISTSIALSTAVLYRLVTFYGPIPLGWIAMKVMQRKDLL